MTDRPERAPRSCPCAPGLARTRRRTSRPARCPAATRSMPHQDQDRALRRRARTFVSLAEQDQVRDTAAQQDRCRLENSIILAFRQHDPLPIGARALHELVLEHQRRTDLGARKHRLRRSSAASINLFGEDSMRGLDLAARVLGDRSPHPHQPLGGREGAKISQARSAGPAGHLLTAAGCCRESGIRR